MAREWAYARGQAQIYGRGDQVNGWLGAQGALAWLGAAFARSAEVEAVYMDEDVLAPGEDVLDPSERRRVGPRLKPGPDPDLLAQTPYVGPALAFRRSALDRVGLQPEAGEQCVRRGAVDVAEAEDLSVAGRVR